MHAGWRRKAARKLAQEEADLKEQEMDEPIMKVCLSRMTTDGRDGQSMLFSQLWIQRRMPDMKPLFRSTHMKLACGSLGHAQAFVSVTLWTR